MVAHSYLGLSNGRTTQYHTRETSAGSADAGQIPSLDGNGKLDATFLPPINSSFRFDQGSPSATWVIVHNLTRYPSVVVTDSSGREVEGDVHYDSLAQVTVTFTAAFSGVAFCN